MFIVYLIVNKLDGKVYVGKTCQRPWKRRWSAHKSFAKINRQTYLYEAMRCYGVESFDIVKIDETTAIETSSILEKQYIAAFESHLPDKGYNLTLGGEGIIPNQETRIKMSIARKGKSPANKGKELSPERRQWLSQHFKGRTPWMKGRKHTPEALQKMSLKLTGRVDSPETKARKSAALTGRPVTPETREKLSAANTGHVVSPEQRVKLSAALKGKPWSPARRKIQDQKEKHEHLF